MKPIKALAILGVFVVAIVAAVMYIPKPEEPAADSTASQSQPDGQAASKDGKKPAKEAPRLEEKYGFTGQGVGL